MKWYHYVAAFFAGAFLSNTIPHLVNGISGDPFPSPFANPPGKGLSSPTINVAWACLNLFIGYILLQVSRVSPKNRWLMAVLFAGFVIMSLMLSDAFIEKMHP